MKAVQIRVPDNAPVAYRLDAGLEFTGLPESIRIELDHAHRTFIGHAERMETAYMKGNQAEMRCWNLLASNTLSALITRFASPEIIHASKNAGLFQLHCERAAFMNLQLCGISLFQNRDPERLKETLAILWSTFHIKGLSQSMLLSLEYMYKYAGGYNQLN